MKSDTTQPPLRAIEGGLQLGNSDLADSCQWAPSQREPERPLLPGCEHQAALAGRTWRDAA